MKKTLSRNILIVGLLCLALAMPVWLQLNTTLNFPLAGLFGAIFPLLFLYATVKRTPMT